MVVPVSSAADLSVPPVQLAQPASEPPPPVLAAWGAGVNSTAMVIELAERGEPPDAVLLAEMPERPETLEFIPLFRRWMDERGIFNDTVRYTPKRFKHWPPYYDLLENLLTNGTLPSISFGRHLCSQKWKIAPQDRWTERWRPAIDAWARGQKVIKLIGYDCSPADNRRYAEREGNDDPRYLFRSPLRDWGWDRDACIERIRAAGLPVCPKSSCFFCAAMKPHEIRTLPPAYLRLIVLVEARAAPRLRNVDGLWRKPIKGRGAGEARPGSMTEFIRAERLLEPREIDRIIAEAPRDLVAFQEAAAGIVLAERAPLGDWIARFNAGVERLAA
jgi:hypothetical protein